MTILIIEDEDATARKLRRMLADVAPSATVLGQLASIDESVSWLREHPAPDLIFMDIELADGQSFEIFNRVSVTCPVVFTTAYDEYAIRAFRVNSVDYLLKPIREADLRQALAKLQTLKETFSPVTDALPSALRQLLNQLQPHQNPPTNTRTPDRNRFLVKQGQRLFSVPIEEVRYFFSRHKISFLKTSDGHEYMLDYTMDELEAMLNPAHFFRLNRQVIAGVRAISNVHLHFNGKLKVALQPAFSDETIVSREKAAEFKQWLGA